MAVILKRSTTTRIAQECVWRCCSNVYGKNVSKIRRIIKRAERREWMREARDD